MPNFNSNNPSEFGWGEHGNHGQIVPFAYRGSQFYSGISRSLVPLATQILNEIVPHIPGGLYQAHSAKTPDDGMWGFEDRANRNANLWSFHAFGQAIDVNAVQNPNNTPNAHGQFVLPDICAAICRKYGWLWGGEWGDKMHLENHNTPSEVSLWNQKLTHPVFTPPPPKPGANTFPLPAGYYYGPYSGPTESISGQGKNDAQYQNGLRAAQRKLGVAADGLYGPITANAVKHFQSTHHITADGFIGITTWKALGL